MDDGRLVNDHESTGEPDLDLRGRSRAILVHARSRMDQIHGRRPLIGMLDDMHRLRSAWAVELTERVLALLAMS
jgi:hypothetical protein